MNELFELGFGFYRYRTLVHHKFGKVQTGLDGCGRVRYGCVFDAPFVHVLLRMELDSKERVADSFDGGHEFRTAVIQRRSQWFEELVQLGRAHAVSGHAPVMEVRCRLLRCQSCQHRRRCILIQSTSRSVYLFVQNTSHRYDPNEVKYRRLPRRSLMVNARSYDSQAVK